MGVPAELKNHAHESGIGAYSLAFRSIQRDLGKVESQITSVEILAKQDQRSALRKFFALEKATDADHWLSVNAVVLGREVRILAPFRRGLSIPYSVEITLSAALTITATYRKGLARRAAWVVEPALAEHRDKPKELEALKLPDVGWRHDSGGIPILLNEGGRLGVSASATGRRVTWTVFSAYQGFLIGVGPRISKYVQAAPQVEALLTRWATDPAKPSPQAIPKPPRKVEAPPPAEVVASEPPKIAPPSAMDLTSLPKSELAPPSALSSLASAAEDLMGEDPKKPGRD